MDANTLFANPTIEKVSVYLDKGGDINAVDHEGYNLLHIAVCARNSDIINLLIKKGANVNGKSKNYNTPLHFAVVNNYKDIMKILIENGADTTVPNGDGRSCDQLSFCLYRSNVYDML